MITQDTRRAFLERMFGVSALAGLAAGDTGVAEAAQIKPGSLKIVCVDTQARNCAASRGITVARGVRLRIRTRTL